jgi:hypothetical protein
LQEDGDDVTHGASGLDYVEAQNKGFRCTVMLASLRGPLL